MRKLSNFKRLTILLGIMTVPAAGQAASLLEVYQQALQSDPLIHEAEARRLAALEAEPQARGVMLPQIDASGSWDKSHTDGSGVTYAPGANPSDPTGPPIIVPYSYQSLSRGDTKSWQVNLRQTLFRWDQIVNLRRADKTVAKAEADREAAQQDLIIRVANAYFAVLAAEDTLTSTHKNRQAIARQLEQAKQRYEVGLIAITDVQESQAAHDQAVADEIQAKRELATAREQMREITGEYVGELSAPTDEFPMRAPERNEKEWVDLALSQNLALVSSRLDEELALDEISYRRTGHYPTVDLVASTGNQTQESRRDTGSGYLDANSDFDSDSIGIQVTVPLFSGGYTSSRVREAVYLHRAAREQLQRVTRETERQTRDAYLGVLSELSRVDALKQAVASSRTALEATQAGFDVGTRTIVDVLNSQFGVYRSITLYYRARYDYLLNVLSLKQAAGNLQIEDLEEIDKWLKDRPTPEQAFAQEAAEGDEESPAEETTESEGP
jgi:outer membrane protein